MGPPRPHPRALWRALVGGVLALTWKREWWEGVRVDYGLHLPASMEEATWQWFVREDRRLCRRCLLVPNR